MASGIAVGQTWEAGPITMEVTEFPHSEEAGYTGYLIEMQNRSLARPHEVTLRMPAELKEASNFFTMGLASQHINAMTKRLVVPPGATLQVPLWQPGLSSPGRNADVLIDGKKQASPLRIGLQTSMPSYRGYFTQVLVASEALATIMEEALEESNAEENTQLNITFIAADLPPSRWSASALAYDTFHSIALSAEEFDRLPPGVKLAMEDFVRGGGELHILGDWTPPEEWTNRPPRIDRAEQTNQALYPLSLGVVFVTPGPVREAARKAARATNYDFSMEVAPSRLSDDSKPLMEELPTRSLFWGLALFSALAGPGLTFGLRRLKRSVWMLWMLPGLSLVAAGVLVATAVAMEGFVLRARTMAIVFLDQTAGKASYLANNEFYTTIATEQGMRYPANVKVSYGFHSVGREDSGQRFLSMDQTEGQFLDQGWLVPRIPLRLQTSAVANRRERLVFELEGETLRCLNGLGADITSLLVVLPNGDMWKREGLAAGRNLPLSMADEEYWDDFFQQTNAHEALAWRGEAPHTSRWYAESSGALGRYFAITDGAALVDSPLAEYPQLPGRSLIVGRFAFGSPPIAAEENADVEMP